jgi:hypothetical protein
MNEKRFLDAKALLLFGGMFFLSFILVSCGQTKPALAVETEPAQTIIDEQGTNDFSLVLNDMDVTEDETNTIYRHKYIVLNPKEDRLDVDSTGWENVSEAFFQQHENDLGMELISYHNGSFSNHPKPVGFDWAIGNENHGEWVVDSTNVNNTGQQQERTWRYRPGSFFLTYWLLSRTTRYGTYGNYASNYRGRSGFYGSGANTYGTNSTYQRANRSQFYSRKTSSSSWSSYNTRKSKSSSRYGGGSSSRGRSGGFGK